MKICVVTGSSGFLGHHLVARLEREGWTIRCIDIQNYIPRDIRDILPIDPAFAGASHVFHLAALADIVPSIANPAEYMDVNVMGTIRVLEAARHVGAKVIYAASASCYGELPKVPALETDQCYPRYPYALSKYMGEQAVAHWGHIYKMDWCSLRIFNAYGRGMRQNGAYGGVFKVWMPQRLAGAPLTVIGDGHQRRDFVHVDDVCSAFLLAAENGKRIYNVGANESYPVIALAGMIGGKLTFLPERRGEPEITQADTTRLRDLGWNARVTFECGVSEMMAHLDDWAGSKVWTPEGIAEATRAWTEALG